MSDAFSDAIRRREKLEDKHRGVPVYIVVIGNSQLSSTLVGAAYWKEHEAQREVKRLNAANRHNRAYHVCRWLKR